MGNLLEETIERLKDNGKNPNDVRWVGTKRVMSDWANFEKVANRDYDGGYGGQEVATNLLIVGDDWWLERHEYDGSEWWEFKCLPQKPHNKIIIKQVIGGSWETLEELNNIEIDN